MAKRCLDKFNVQGLANMAWAFATVGQKDEQLFKALARMDDRRLEKFRAQELANTAWAFATVGQQDEQLFKAFRKALQRSFLGDLQNGCYVQSGATTKSKKNKNLNYSR